MIFHTMPHAYYIIPHFLLLLHCFLLKFPTSLNEFETVSSLWDKKLCFSSTMLCDSIDNSFIPIGVGACPRNRGRNQGTHSRWDPSPLHANMHTYSSITQ